MWWLLIGLFVLPALPASLLACWPAVLSYLKMNVLYILIAREREEEARFVLLRSLSFFRSFYLSVIYFLSHSSFPHVPHVLTFFTSSLLSFFPAVIHSKFSLVPQFLSSSLAFSFPFHFFHPSIHSSIPPSIHPFIQSSNSSIHPFIKIRST